MGFKRLLAESEGGLHNVRATATDCLRDGLGPQAAVPRWSPRPSTSAASSAGRVVFSAGSFFEAASRRNGVARALIARVAAHATAIGSPMVEPSVRADNPAQLLYRQAGFQVLPP